MDTHGYPFTYIINTSNLHEDVVLFSPVLRTVPGTKRAPSKCFSVMEVITEILKHLEK